MATTITRESMTDNVTVWNVTRIGSSIYDRIDSLIGSAITFGGLINAEGYGQHSWSAAGAGLHSLDIRNTTSGTGAIAGLRLGNNSAVNLGVLFAFSSAWTTSGQYIASGLTIECSGAGGLNMNASSTGALRLYTADTLRLTVSNAGVITPSSATILAGFLAYNSADDTAVASGTTIDFDTEVYDEGGHFASDTFTAPVAGRYLLTAAARLTNTSGGAIEMGASFHTSNHANGYSFGVQTGVANNATIICSGSIVVDMDASDTAYVRYNGGGQCTVVGLSTLRGTWFSGRLLL